MSTLADRLRKEGPEPGRRKKRTEPLWKGPEEDGVTFSLLSRFLTCRERFRLLVVEGLRAADQFNHRIEYGSMWHVCEEHLAGLNRAGGASWMNEPTALRDYVTSLCRRYPLAQDQVDHWYNVCKVQFPVYVDYWRQHPDVVDRRPLLQEQVFAVPYKLPSGRVVKLRGKWDSVDVIGKGKGAGIYLQENKTKGDVREGQLRRQLTFDLQTMLYLVALTEDQNDPSGHLASAQDNTTGWLVKGHAKSNQAKPILGVRYNVIRRPLSGGKGTIVRHEPSKKNPAGESKEAFYERLRGIIQDSPADYFMRFKVEVGAQDVAKFRRECLDPILEQLCDWWEGVSLGPDEAAGLAMDRIQRGTYYPVTHWRHPFGVWNVLDEGGSSDVDEYLATGSTVGLEQTEDLFPELAGG